MHWVEIDSKHQSQLGGSQQLGKNSLLGRALRDAHSKFRLVLGPMSQEKYESFLPGQSNSQKILDWVRQYTGVELSWDAVLCLPHHDVQGIRLGQAKPLGLASWLGTRTVQQGDADDLIMDYEQRYQLARHGQSTERTSLEETSGDLSELELM